MLKVAEELWETDKRGRVSYRGGGGPGTSTPRNLEIEYGYYCFVTGIKQQSCPRLRQKQSERIYINSQFSWWGLACPQTHAR